ncbi:MAG: hypothetical protein KF861_07175 [Planctomycetaceae bacterium]|nr:hypothetical protein [Planctomycetaceae bacterium]
MSHSEPLDWEPYDRHWIRLRGPWDVLWISPFDEALSSLQERSRRVKMPADWRSLFGERSGTARFSRRFQRPTNLDDDERIVVTLCGVRCAVNASLNGSSLSPLTRPLGDPACKPCEDSQSFDITDRLVLSNQLQLDLTVSKTALATGPCGLWQPVFLEVITAE